jgi:NAD(P)-dependent dehydrogenase (short-subunit alcohol dehydrogenase family)
MPDRSGWDRKPGFDLSGKKAVVVGASTEEGLVAVAALTEAGASVAAIDVVGPGETARTPDGSGTAGGYTDTWDLRDPSAVTEGYERMVARFGAPTILVTAQDQWDAALIEDTSDDAYRRIMAVVADGTYFTCRAFLRSLPADASSARIICMSTIFGERGLESLSAYSTAHGAVQNLIRALAQELGARGITTNGIATGWMTNTPGRGPDEIAVNLLMRFMPIRRFGRPDEIGPLVVLLASEAAGNISGQILHVDGGVTTHI